MGRSPAKRILVDTNLIIYSQQQHYEELRRLLAEATIASNPIIRIEVIGWRNLPDHDKLLFDKFFANVIMLPLSKDIYDETIELRQNYKIRMADALIAATALCHDLELWTANLADFKPVKELRVFNPLA